MSNSAKEEARQKMVASLRDLIETVQGRLARLSAKLVNATARTDLSPRQYHRLAKLINSTMLQRGDLPKRIFHSDRKHGELGRVLLFVLFAMKVLREIEASPGVDAQEQPDEQGMGTAVREEREKHGLSLAETGPKFGMTESELADLENGKIPPDLAAAIKTEVAPENAEEVQEELFGDIDRKSVV